MQKASPGCIPGYKGTPERWEKGTEPKKIKWYAGMQYDGDIARAKQRVSMNWISTIPAPRNTR